MKQFNVGDIVFVSDYGYKNGTTGTSHNFVIIDDGQAVDLNYFGFLISSQIKKATYPFNEMLYKNNTNNLHKDSIVKCDDLIKFSEDKIQFKIGEVTTDEYNTFITTYAQYLSENKD